MVVSRIVRPDSVSTDGSIDGINSCVEEALVDDVVVSSGATAPASTEVEGEFALEICAGDPLVACECRPVFLPPGDFGRRHLKIARNRSRFLGSS